MIYGFPLPRRLLAMGAKSVQNWLAVQLGASANQAQGSSFMLPNREAKLVATPRASA